MGLTTRWPLACRIARLRDDVNRNFSKTFGLLQFKLKASGQIGGKMGTRTLPNVPPQHGPTRGELGEAITRVLEAAAHVGAGEDELEEGEHEDRNRVR